MITRLPMLLLLSVLALAWTPASVHGAGPRDLLEPGRFPEYIKANASQEATLGVFVDSIRSAIESYQYTYGKQTNEGWLWQGFMPSLQDLHELEKATRKVIDTYLDSIRRVLDENQQKRLDRVLKSKQDLLDHPVTEHQFHQVNNSPLNRRFNSATDTYRITLPDPGWTNTVLGYPDLLKQWTVRAYVQQIRATTNQSLATASDIQIESMSPTIQRLIVQSPILVAATLTVPELLYEEFELLYAHYPNTFESKASAWDDFRNSHRMDDQILVRLKMSTPLGAYHLRTDRYIIYLEDSDGVGYEPTIEEASHHKLEVLHIDLPGRTEQITDVFGNYTGVPGYTATRYLDFPTTLAYTGQEKLLKLYFPGTDFQGNPLIREGVKHVKLIVQPEDESFPRLELRWNLKDRPPKAIDRS